MSACVALALQCDLVRFRTSMMLLWIQLSSHSDEIIEIVELVRLGGINM